MKMSFYDLFEQIWIRKKPTIASTTSELSDGLRKNNSFMSICIENCAQNSQKNTAFWVLMEYLLLVKASSVKDFNFKPMKLATSL